DRVRVVEAYSGRQLELGPFDHVVVADHGRPEEQLYLALKGRVEVHRAGDCVAPRRAENAVVEGHRVAMGL
ncbi:MAG TPA: mycofactocin system FadH/OYE family oxidoreductase 2, partial [Candidatus Dormibacteraeota bacterium]|nr:mycofactocin system FadH/OYE family oxidoreductase 2 [Candidatus Dormibacteraeota bacterium]